jgi:hypothetical protein
LFSRAYQMASFDPNLIEKHVRVVWTTGGVLQT